VGDALERVDPSEADIEFLAAELLDRPREPLGVLPFAVQRERPSREVRANDQHDAADRLNEMAPEVAFGLRPIFRLQLPAGLNERELGDVDDDREQSDSDSKSR
jgi:hypothetical protein